MSEQISIEGIAVELLDEKIEKFPDLFPAPGEALEELKDQLFADMLVRIESFMNKALCEAVPISSHDELQELFDTNASDDELAAFFTREVKDVERTMLQGIQNFVVVYREGK